MEDFKYLTEKQAAKVLGLSVGALRSLRKRAKVPYTRIAERTIRYNEADLKTFVEKRTTKPTKW